MSIKKRFSFLIVLILLIIGGIAAWWVTAIAPVDVSDKTQKAFTVKPGEGIREIANDLKSQGLINNTVAFFLLVKVQNLDNKIQAGNFRLSRNMNLQTITQNLTHGSLDVWITLPEGVRSEEVADILKDKLPSFNDSWRQPLKEHEGYLFPDTYLFPTNVTVNQVLSTMTNNFEKKYAMVSGPRQSKYTKQELVTIASMVEREALFDEDRPLVASVIYNRLAIGMALNIDATVQYALGYQSDTKKWWKKELTTDDLQINSSYNTYKHVGLPPTPISNPGLATLQAVANAPTTNYIYYISDKSGHNHYATTLQQHNANIQKYGL